MDTRIGIKYIIFLVTNVNKEITYVTLKSQNLPWEKDEIAISSEKSCIAEKPVNKGTNLFVKVYI